MGKYSGQFEKIKEGDYDYEGNYQSLETSLKVLDAIDENTLELPMKQAFVILDDAKELLIQMVGIN